MKEEVSSRVRPRGNFGLSGDQHYPPRGCSAGLAQGSGIGPGGRSWKASMQSEVFAVYSQARGKEWGDIGKLRFRKINPSAVLRCTGVKKSWQEVKTRWRASRTFQMQSKGPSEASAG